MANRPKVVVAPYIINDREPMWYETNKARTVFNKMKMKWMEQLVTKINWYDTNRFFHKNTNQTRDTGEHRKFQSLIS